MLKRVIILTLVIFTAGACAKKPVNEGGQEPTTAAGNNPTAQDTNIANKDLSFDPQGSDSGNISGLYTVHFDYDKSALSTEARDLLAKNYDWMKAHPNSNVQIEGHCDSKGSIEYNLALGERRAKAVREYLASLGADKSQMSIISYGKEKPLDNSGTPEGDSKNRRANFVVISR